MAITKAFEVWEQETENKGRRARDIEIALNMLKDNLPLEQIVRLTGLTIEQVQALQAEQN